MALTLEWDTHPAHVQCSVTWWHGEHDANVPIAAVRRLLKRTGQVDLRVWTEAGHLAAVPSDPRETSVEAPYA